MASLAVPRDVLYARLDALERVARGLSRGEIVSLVTALRDPPKLVTWPARDPFWFQGTGGIRFEKHEKDALGELWTRMLVGLAFAVTGEEIEEWGRRAGLLGSLDRLLVSERQLAEGRATTVLERTLGGDVWLGAIGVWNAFCAALLGERFPSALRGDLEATWAKVMGRKLVVGPPSATARDS